MNIKDNILQCKFRKIFDWIMMTFLSALCVYFTIKYENIVLSLWIAIVFVFYYFKIYVRNDRYLRNIIGLNMILFNIMVIFFMVISNSLDYDLAKLIDSILVIYSIIGFIIINIPSLDTENV